MLRKRTTKTIALLGTAVLILLICSIALLSYMQHTRQSLPVSSESTPQSDSPPGDSPSQPTELYKGEVTPVADSFSIKTPNGWAASISTKSSFLGIMFARPNQLESLKYNADTPPTIDKLGIPAWSGLSEHFFVIAPTVSRQFNPDDHLNISSEEFIFNDGTIGKKYFVVKYANEAQKWGGLQKDTEWQGRTYIYEKDGKHIEAHIAVYPSSSIDIEFYENVVKTLQLHDPNAHL